MMVLMTSSTPKRRRNHAGTNAHAAPASAPEARTRGSTRTLLEWSSANPAETAAAAPTSSCPSAPMLITPAVKARATASPVSIKGVDRTSVADEIACDVPNEPRQGAAGARPGSYPLTIVSSATNAAIAATSMRAATATLTVRRTPCRADDATYRRRRNTRYSTTPLSQTVLTSEYGIAKNGYARTRALLPPQCSE